MAGLQTTNQNQTPKGPRQGRRGRASEPQANSVTLTASGLVEAISQATPPAEPLSPAEVLQTAASAEAQAAQALLQAQAEYEKTCRDEYARYTSHLWEQRRDSQSHADNLVLTLSSAFLALSAGILKSVVPVDHVVALRLLYGSWLGFGVAIIGTLFSYHLSKKSLDEHIDKCDDYFFKADQNAFQGVNANKRNTEKCNNLSSTAFVVGLALTLTFVGANIQTEKNRMSNETKTVRMVDKQAPSSGTVPFGETAPKPPALPKQPSATNVPSVTSSQPSPQAPQGNTK